MKLERTLKISDLLTAITLLLSTIALVSSWSKDREVELRQDADRVRTAAAKCISKLDRWQVLRLAVFEELQVAYVQTSERVAADQKNLGAARDFLWKEVTASHGRANARISDEQIESAYSELIATFPSIRDDFVGTLEQLRAIDEKNLDVLLHGTQAAVLEVDLEDYSPPKLGNALRSAAAEARTSFLSETQPLLEKIRGKLFSIVQRDDRAVVEGARFQGEATK